MTVRRGVLLVALTGLLALFVGLAAWQVERRAWKHALIERVDARVHATPVDAPDRTRWPRLSRDDDAYRHVRVDGVFVAGRETFVQAVTVFGNGYWVLVPLRRDDGTIVLVNRGFVRQAERSTIDRVPGHVTIDGLLRVTEPGGGFLQHNDAATDRWYSRDVAAIAAARGLSDVAPYFVDADADPADAADAGQSAVARGRPVGGLTVVSFTDHHALYAIVWSLLALLVAWAVVRVARGDPPTS